MNLIKIKMYPIIFIILPWIILTTSITISPNNINQSNPIENGNSTNHEIFTDNLYTETKQSPSVFAIRTRREPSTQRYKRVKYRNSSPPSKRRPTYRPRRRPTPIKPSFKPSYFGHHGSPPSIKIASDIFDPAVINYIPNNNHDFHSDANTDADNGVIDADFSPYKSHQYSGFSSGSSYKPYEPSSISSHHFPPSSSSSYHQSASPAFSPYDNGNLYTTYDTTNTKSFGEPPTLHDSNSQSAINNYGSIQNSVGYSQGISTNYNSGTNYNYSPPSSNFYKGNYVSAPAQPPSTNYGIPQAPTLTNYTPKPQNMYKQQQISSNNHYNGYLPTTKVTSHINNYNNNINDYKSSVSITSSQEIPIDFAHSSPQDPYNTQISSYDVPLHKNSQNNQYQPPTLPNSYDHEQFNSFPAPSKIQNHHSSTDYSPYSDLTNAYYENAQESNKVTKTTNSNQQQQQQQQKYQHNRNRNKHKSQSPANNIQTLSSSLEELVAPSEEYVDELLGTQNSQEQHHQQQQQQQKHKLSQYTTKNTKIHRRRPNNNYQSTTPHVLDTKDLRDAFSSGTISYSQSIRSNSDENINNNINDSSAFGSRKNFKRIKSNQNVDENNKQPNNFVLLTSANKTKSSLRNATNNEYYAGIRNTSSLLPIKNQSTSASTTRSKFKFPPRNKTNSNYDIVSIQKSQSQSYYAGTASPKDFDIVYQRPNGIESRSDENTADLSVVSSSFSVSDNNGDFESQRQQHERQLQQQQQYLNRGRSRIKKQNFDSFEEIKHEDYDDDDDNDGDGDDIAEDDDDEDIDDYQYKNQSAEITDNVEKNTTTNNSGSYGNNEILLDKNSLPKNHKYL